MQVSLVKILKSDYVSLLALMAPSIMLLMYIDSLTLGLSRYLRKRGDINEPMDPTIFLYIFIGSIVVCIPYLVYRINSIKKIFENGIETEGEISKITFHKDRGRIFYKYEHENKNHEASQAVHQSKFVKSLKEGQNIKLVVNRDKPEQALIKEMYVK